VQWLPPEWQTLGRNIRMEGLQHMVPDLRFAKKSPISLINEPYFNPKESLSRFCGALVRDKPFTPWKEALYTGGKEPCIKVEKSLLT